MSRYQEKLLTDRQTDSSTFIGPSIYRGKMIFGSARH